MLLSDLLECLLAIIRFDDGIASGHEQSFQQFDILDFIIDDQDFCLQIGHPPHSSC
jgi:hypothetical protein